MTENDFSTYQMVWNLNEATALTTLLAENNIDFQLEDTSESFDPSFANNEVNKEFRIKLRKQDFEQADQLLLSLADVPLDEVEKDYYLFDFSDEELMDILSKPDEWGKFDYVLAQKILKDRGQGVSEKALENLRKQRLEELAKPEDGQKKWIVMGYVFAFLGGLLGIFIGWHLHSYKKTLPNGDLVYGYSDRDRMHGSSILALGILSLVLSVIVKLLIND